MHYIPSICLKRKKKKTSVCSSVGPTAYPGHVQAGPASLSPQEQASTAQEHSAPGCLPLSTGCFFLIFTTPFYARVAFETASSWPASRIRKLLPSLCFCHSNIFYSPLPNSVPRDFKSFLWARAKGTICQHEYAHGNNRQRCSPSTSLFKACSLDGWCY